MSPVAQEPPKLHPAADGLAHAIEHARILRAAGDATGAARVLDDAFAAEGVHAPAASERLRFRALLQRADLALVLHTLQADATPSCALGIDALARLTTGLAELDGVDTATSDG